MTTQLCSYIIAPLASESSAFARKIQSALALKLQQAYSELDCNAFIISQYSIETNDQASIKTVHTETEAISEIEQVISEGYPVIYNPINCDRALRILFLRQVSHLDAKWIGWGINVELESNKDYSNLSKEAQDLFAHLPPLPPWSGEGFVKSEKVKIILSSQSPSTNNSEIKQIKFSPEVLEKNPNRMSAGRKNRSSKNIQHQYSQLLDFDRLMHLIALLIHYPGLGELSKSDPDLLQEALNKPKSQPLPVFEDELAEICAVMTEKYHQIYADREAIAQDLAWLEENGFMSIDDQTKESREADNFLTADLTLSEIDIRDIDESTIHHYSDRASFERLLKFIRFILYQPFYKTENQEAIIKGIKDKLKLYKLESALRKDIELVLNPYGILDHQTNYRRKGYYLGTAILSKPQIQNIYKLLKSRTIRFNDHPETLEIYEKFQDRMKKANLLPSDDYEFIVVKVNSFIDQDSLYDKSLAREEKMEELKEAFYKGKCLKLCRRKKAAQYNNDNVDNEFLAYPLQIIFHKIGWYLGCQIAGESNQKDLFCYQRLDRLYKVCENSYYQRSFSQQKQARRKLEILYEASPGIYLGNKVDLQKKYLKNKKDNEATITVQLWLTEWAYYFVREGRLRFGKDHGEPIQQNNKQFPYKLELIFPKWSMQDLDLKRWILGFQGGIKVNKPWELKKQIQEETSNILDTHRD